MTPEVDSRVTLAELPGLEEAKTWIGRRVDELDGATVARLEGIYVDAANGEPRWLQVRLGRFGRRTLIPYIDSAPAAGRIWVPHQRASVRHAPELEENEQLTGRRELEFCLHYGIRPGAGRSLEIKDRGPDAVTSRPA